MAAIFKKVNFEFLRVLQILLLYQAKCFSNISPGEGFLTAKQDEAQSILHGSPLRSHWRGRVRIQLQPVYLAVTVLLKGRVKKEEVC